MESAAHPRTDWKLLFGLRGFRYFFAAMFVSLFGSGMNFSGVSWHVLAETHSTVKVSWVVIMVTLPGLVVPFLGGVLIDRLDRRYLGISLDLVRGGIVLATAAIAYFGHVQLWQLYLMTLTIGMGFSMYWSTVNALVQEVIPAGQLVGANAAVLIAVQSGMMAAGSLVGFIYDRAGISGILAIDGATYLISAFCLHRLRSGYFPPREAQHRPHLYSEATEAAAEALETSTVPPIAEAGLVLSMYADLKEGFRYLRDQPRVLSLGVALATMMAGVVSANVLVVALANNILRAGARGFGFLESGWAIGAILGGLAAGALVRSNRLGVLVAAMGLLAVGHAVVPYVTVLAGAVAMQALFGYCRALGGVLTQSMIMTIVPRRLMGRTQSAFAVISTTLQVLMSFSLGWVAQRMGLTAGFGTLALLYTMAVLAAMRARALNRTAAETA